MDLIKALSLRCEELIQEVLRIMSNDSRYEVISDGDNYIFCVPNTKNITPFLYVSHMDTVRTATTEIDIKQSGNAIYNAGGILGGDDRCGVYILLRLKDEMEHPPFLLFTNYEECGHMGVSEFVKSGYLDDHIGLINAFFEWDRRGISEYVTYNDNEKAFDSRMLELGLEKKCGSYSDIKTLSNKYLVASANLAAGYFNQHTASEYVITWGVELAISIGKTLTKFFGDRKYTCSAPKPVATYTYAKRTTHKNTMYGTCKECKKTQVWIEGEDLCYSCYTDRYGSEFKSALRPHLCVNCKRFFKEVNEDGLCFGCVPEEEEREYDYGSIFKTKTETKQCKLCGYYFNTLNSSDMCDWCEDGIVSAQELRCGVCDCEIDDGGHRAVGTEDGEEYILCSQCYDFGKSFGIIESIEEEEND